jgi:phenylpyruvate tautomerase PptA (4-oxalocrotonate tautomerase family)
MNNLQLLIKKAEAKNKKSSFTVKGSPFINVEITYSEDDLTKNYVKFLTDVFASKFGDISINQIEALGDSIKTSPTDFRKSYQTKKSVIKEIADGVYIHTSMNSHTMRIKIENVVESFYGSVVWPKDLSDDLEHGGIMEDNIILTDDIIKKMYLFQIERENLEDSLNKIVTPIEFKRFVSDFSATYFTSYFSCLEYHIEEWKKTPNKYKSDDYRD